MITINQATIDLIKRWEGFKASAYRCPAGKWTIGYGITASAGIGVDPKPGMRVTEAEAEAHLRKALEKFAGQIRPAIAYPINENEFGAFLSLTYNIGPGGFRGSSALRHFNAGDKERAAAAIKLWNKATVNGKRQVLRGLVNRRADEVRLFQSPVASQPLPTKPGAVHEPVQSDTQAPGWLSALIAAVVRLLKGGRG